VCIKIKIINDKMLDKILFSISNAKDQGIVKIRLEDCRMLKRAVDSLKYFCRTVQCITSIALVNVTFSDGGTQDFKHLIEAIASNAKITHFAVQHTDFNEDFHGKTIARCILESRSLKELDLSYINFEDPKSFYEMANGLLNERCRLLNIRLKGIQFGQLESKVMQFILMRNKSL
jgi:hypothetical protein